MRKQALTLFEVAALAILLLAAGCHKVDQSAGDPADANLAPTGGAVNDSLAGAGSAQQPAAYPAGTAASRPAASAQVSSRNAGAGSSYASGYASGTMPPPPPEDTYGAQAQQEPGTAGYADAYAAAPYDTNGTGYDPAGAGYEQAAYADTPPPPLPEYEQPPCPGDNYLWTPGYWNYAQSGYFWVPGVWVVAPFIGALWTPGYWGFEGSRYGFHHGYWGPHIGFYGGINYGYGFYGRGYEGGYWNHNNFFYNRSVTVINNNVRNVYVRNVSYRNFGNRVAYNGGRGGLDAQPAPYEQAAAREQHFGALPAQQQHIEQARMNRAQFSVANSGRPQLLADARPLGGRTAATPLAARLAPLAGREAFGQAGAGGLAQEPSRSSASSNQPFAGRTLQSMQQGSRQAQQDSRQGQPAHGEGDRPPVIVNGNGAAAGQERAQGTRLGMEEQRALQQQEQEQVRARQQGQQRPQSTQQPRIVEDQNGSQGRSATQPRQPYQPQPQQRIQPQFTQPRATPAPEAQPRPEQSRPEQSRPEQSRPEQPQPQPRPQPQVFHPSQPRSAPAPQPREEPARPAGGQAGGAGGHGPR